MNSENVGTLAQRLSEIGFSDRAVAMIIEQVEQLGEENTRQEDGLAEDAVKFQTLQYSLEQQSSQFEPQSINFFAIAGVCAVLLSIVLGWTALTSSGQADLTIMTSNAVGANWFQGLQAVLLAGWVAIPPLLSAWRGDLEANLRELPVLTIWGSFGFVLAILLIASSV